MCNSNLFIYPNVVRCTSEYPYYNQIKSSLTKSKIETVRDQYDYINKSWKYKKEEVTEILYTEMENQDIIFSRGFLDIIDPQLISQSIQCYDSQVYIPNDISDDEIRTALNSFELRDDQVTAVRKALAFKRGTVQLPTGCFTGDTVLLTISRSSKATMKELSYLGGSSVCSISPYHLGMVEILADYKSVDLVKQTTELVKITLDNQYELRCTPEHPFMLTDYTFKLARNLSCDDHLMSVDLDSLEKCKEIHKITSIEFLSVSPTDVYDVTDVETQVYAVRVTDSTGVLVHNSGKTAILATICKLLIKYNPHIRLAIFEPTIVLVEDVLKFLKFNNIKACSYKEACEGSDANIIVSHPKSVLTSTNLDLMSSIQGVIWDECQHVGCETYTTVNSYLTHAEISLGFSALVVDESHIYSNISDLTTDEAKVIGCCGRVLMHVPPSYYIEKGLLATPIVFRMQYQIPSQLTKIYDWTKLSKGVHNDISRIELITNTTKEFVELGRRILILVPTKKLANELASNLLKQYDYTTILSFGAREGYIIDPIRGKTRINNAPTLFNDNDDYQIMIATSHLDEGADLRKLDVCVLAGGGKSSRRLVQRIGRILRLSKSGKYAYIVDFRDDGNPILKKHRAIRMNIYLNELAIDPLHHIYDKVRSDQIKDLVLQLEE